MSDWNNQRIVILGAARQGVALARYLGSKGVRVVLSDLRPLEEFSSERKILSDYSIHWVCGQHPSSLLDNTDLLCISGGVPTSIPIVKEAVERGIPLTNDSQIFLEEVPCLVVGITGSAGKTTTTSLIGDIAKSALGKTETPPWTDKTLFQPTSNVWVGGNIGSPLISFVDEMQSQDLAIMELSSFQLEIMTRSPQVAVILNITPNHLDRHGTMTNYVSAKARILQGQSKDDVAILGHDDPQAWKLADQVNGQLISFGINRSPINYGTYLQNDKIVLDIHEKSYPLLSRSDIPLLGNHNLMNISAASAVSAYLGINQVSIQQAVKNFKGIPHRLEFVRNWGGANWYNDSIATAPERVIAAINSFEQPLVLLAGGRDKNLPWDDFATHVSEHVKHLILFGEARAKIARIVENQNKTQPKYQIKQCNNLQDAVQTALDIVHPGDVVLLSPGGTSFDEFKDFEERGEYFKELLMQL